MDMLYFKQPIFLLLPVILLTWILLTCLLKRKNKLSKSAEIIMAAIGVVFHAAAITVILLKGTLSDALLLVLLSSALTLFLSPNPQKVAGGSKEEKS